MIPTHPRDHVVLQKVHLWHERKTQHEIWPCKQTIDLGILFLVSLWSFDNLQTISNTKPVADYTNIEGSRGLIYLVLTMNLTMFPLKISI